MHIDRIVAGCCRRAVWRDWKYCLDFNEGCPNVDYLLEYLARLRKATPEGFARILYIEQPTSRDLARHATMSCTRPPGCVPSWWTRG